MSARPASGSHHVVVPFEEAKTSEYDYIVVGGGGTAAAFIEALLGRAPSTRILVLEQGPFLLPSHVQNLGLAYQPLMGSAAATPWRSDGDLSIVAQVPYLGGRTLMWSGSCPQPSTAQLSNWPREIVEDLDRFWPNAHTWLGVRPASELGPEFGMMHDEIAALTAVASTSDPNLIEPINVRSLDAPLAHPDHIDGKPQKFSAVVPLLRAAATHLGVKIVTECEVQRLEQTDEVITTINTSLGSLSVGSAVVVLATGTTEATGLVLRSRETVPAPNAGLNLAANSASFFTCRLPRSRFDGLKVETPELAALYADGATSRREFHLHVSAVATSDPARDLERIYHLMPDMFGEGTPQRVADNEHVVVVLHGLSEVAGHGTDADASRLIVDDRNTTVGTFRLDVGDHEAWDAMDAATDLVLRHIAGDSPVEYWSHESECWTTELSSRRMPFAFHETGTLWMGESELDSVTDVYGGLHATRNLFVLGGATFPTRGSWNPFLTMVALAMRLADHLFHNRHGSSE